MPNSADLYGVLNVSKNASQDEIKSSYRKLALKFHPDRNKGDKAAEEKFKEATHAYEILSDTQKRKQYDEFGPEGMGASAGFGAGGFGDAFTDIFEDFFGGGAARQRGAHRPARGSDLGTEIEIGFMESVRGCQQKIKVKREEACGQCRGEGSAPGSSKQTCSQCRGAGEVAVSSGFFSMRRTCDRCRGQGSIITHPCPKCHGKGREELSRTIQVKIPPGVENGTRLRLGGEGEAGHKGGPRGDLYVDIFVEAHEIFRRHGSDVLCEIPVSFTQAALGGEVQVPTLEGSATLKIPAGTQTGKVFRMRGKGIPSVKTGAAGDQHIRVVVETPTGLNSKQKELLEEFAKVSGEKVNPLVQGFVEKMKSFLKV